MQAVNGSKYKWMLYGDDDTLWFTGGVLDLLKDLDPDMPYVITGMTQSVALCFAVPAMLSWTGLCCDIVFLCCSTLPCAVLCMLCHDMPCCIELHLVFHCSVLL